MRIPLFELISIGCALIGSVYGSIYLVEPTVTTVFVECTKSDYECKF